jgi:hypothetical protein
MGEQFSSALNEVNRLKLMRRRQCSTLLSLRIRSEANRTSKKKSNPELSVYMGMNFFFRMAMHFYLHMQKSSLPSFHLFSNIYCVAVCQLLALKRFPSKSTSQKCGKQRGECEWTFREGILNEKLKNTKFHEKCAILW